MNEPIPRGRDGFFHPSNEQEVCDLILFARNSGLQVRVRGSGHSLSDAIDTDGRRYRTGRMVDIKLDRMRHIRFNDATKQVTVGAGMHFARDPRDPTGQATDEAGLCYQLHQRGWALPLLGGVTHQTVAGYFSTGSEGGSLKYSLYPQLIGIRLIDGLGHTHELSAQKNADLFHAAGVSLGLLGVITEVTLQCEDRFDVIGEESVASLEKSVPQLFSHGADGFEKFMAQTDYARLLWWPQPGVNKLVTWKADRVPLGTSGEGKRNPYCALPTIFGSTVPMQVLAGAALRMLAPKPNPFWRGKNDIPELPPKERKIASGASRVRSAIYNAFVTETPKPKPFQDSWWQGIPQDNAMVEGLMPTTFTEIFIPMSKATQALERLRAHYERFGFPAAGAFATEIYTAPANQFWMSPAYGEPMLRLNIFWFKRNKGDPRIEFFPQFWGLFADLGFRLHWAKLLFREGDTTASYLRRQYPRWDDFLRVREQLDPDQLFVSSYWRRSLGIPNVRPELLATAPLGRHVVRDVRPPVRKLPLFFSFQPSTKDFHKQAPFVFENQAELEASPEDAYKVFTYLENAKKWLLFFKGAHWLTENRNRPGTVVDYYFAFMTLRVRVIELDVGKSWVSSIDGCTLPLAKHMLQIIDFKTLPNGKSHFHWRIFYDVPWFIRPFHPLARFFFAWLFRRTTRQFADYMLLWRRLPQ